MQAIDRCGQSKLIGIEGGLSFFLPYPRASSRA
jgi:hypothetical protein